MIAAEGTGVQSLDMLVVWIGAFTVIGGALALLWRSTRGLRRIVHRFDEFADDWQGTEGRPGVPARPGVMERLAAFDVRLTGIEHELHPNSGGSLRDAIDRVERQVCDEPGDGPGALRTA